VLEPAQKGWKIEKLVPGGAGFLKLENGQGAFVKGALPGERVHVQRAEDHRAYLQATEWSLVEASPERVEPSCPVQNRCGGCDLMALNYPAQVQAKATLLRDALTRTGRFEDLPEITFLSAAEPLGYRSRIRLHVAAGARLGFFAADSQELVEIPECQVAHPELNAALAVLRRLAPQHAKDFERFSELELRVAPAGPRISLHLVPIRRDFDPNLPLLAALPSSFEVSIGERAPNPDQDQRFPLPGGVTLRVPTGAFSQVNWAMNQLLVQALLDGAARAGARTFCDLYCGAGNFSLPLFTRGLTGLGIETAKFSVAAAKRAAKEQSLTLARFIAGDVRAELERLPRSERFDLVVLDPPRSGAREVLPELLRRAPVHVAYCACDPVTLARDLRVLCDAGYALGEVMGFDMFPHTHHFETLAWLHRTS
jgi:23S rRNA (uracil1939-C5)-methyltransferase